MKQPWLKINGQTYTMEPNPLGITSLEFAAADQEIHCTAWRGAEELQLKGGFGRYLSQHIDGEGLCQICCTWEDDATLTALARFVETLFSRTATLSFAGDELTEDQAELRFRPLELPSIKGLRIRRINMLADLVEKNRSYRRFFQEPITRRCLGTCWVGTPHRICFQPPAPEVHLDLQS